MNNALITGGTGFLGAHLADEMIAAGGGVTALARGETPKETGREVKVIAGDITKQDLGLDKGTLDRVISETDVIFHCAAMTDLTLPIEGIRKVNVEGTRNVLDVAMKCRERGKLKKVNHVSTAYTAGANRDIFGEDEFDTDRAFNNTYERSKFEAELLVLEYREKGLDIDIFRPSIVLGRYSDGRTTNFKMFYQPLHYFSLGFFKKIPALDESRANFINVDTAAKAIFLISRSSSKPNANFNITSPGGPDLKDILDTAEDFFRFKMPERVDPGQFNITKEYTAVKRTMIEPFLPYFRYFTVFNMDNTVSVLNGSDFHFPEIDKQNLVRLFDYCERSGFIKRKGCDAVIG